MKKAFILVLSFGFVLSLGYSNAFAEESKTSPDQQIPKAYLEVLHNWHKSYEEDIKEGESILKEALERRQRNYYKNRLKTNESRNLYNQQQKHLDAIMTDADEVNSYENIAIREGDLQDVPYYDLRRESNQTPIICSNNFKNNMRNRAINYYLEGGNAGVDSICANSITDKDQTVERTPIWHDEYNTVTARKMVKASINYDIRQAQKAAFRNSIDLPTGYQKTSQRIMVNNDKKVNPFSGYYYSFRQSDQINNVNKSTDN